MDLTQKKLSKSEWLNVEVLVSASEQSILRMIIDGYHNVNLRHNSNLSMLRTMKLENTIKDVHAYIFQEYFEPIINNFKLKYSDILIETKSNVHEKTDSKKKKKEKKVQLKKGELIRINSVDKKMDNTRENIFEFTLLKFCGEILASINARNDKYAFYIYTILQLKKATIIDINPYVTQFVNNVIEVTLPQLRMSDILTQAYEFIEKNPHLLKYEDKTLFEHQKQIFTSFRYDHNADETITSRLESMANIPSKLVLYTAPTGTGKTLTPLGLSEGHRIIFICAARHVGLALAKAAVSTKKRIAIAFGCETADDIRLHYYSASVYTTNRRSGGIGKVDNSVGDKVEIMICDVQSYLIAMRYMLAFSPEYEGSDSNVTLDTDLITYWDEPTISMDYDDHPLHATIQNVWRENRISKMVLSCATLPHEDEISDALSDYRTKFPTAQIETISSHDCRKSISVLNCEGKSVVPHLLFKSYTELQVCVEHCIKNKTMLRYFDLVEVTQFLLQANNIRNALDERYHLVNYFEEGISSITMNSLKLYYLSALQHLSEESWNGIHTSLVNEQKTKFEAHPLRKFRSLEGNTIYKPANAGENLTRTQSISVSPSKVSNPSTVPGGVSVTTSDAYTMTDGPSIFLADNVENIGKYYIHTSRIPDITFRNISDNIAHNNSIQTELTVVENKLEDIANARENAASTTDNSSKGKSKGKSDHKYNRDETVVNDNKLSRTADILRSKIVPVNLDHKYVPNMREHQEIWAPNGKKVSNAFVPRISDEEVCEIMALDVDNDKKMLLLLGIGMFVDENTANLRYMEVMKRLATEQQLFMILASSDYIYGTNYQFCHGFIGKDLKEMTQQKTIQAMGRIGRNQTQQEYTIRFRDDNMLYQLFKPPTENKEAVVMCRLFQ